MTVVDCFFCSHISKQLLNYRFYLLNCSWISLHLFPLVIWYTHIQFSLQIFPHSFNLCEIDTCKLRFEPNFLVSDMMPMSRQKTVRDWAWMSLQIANMILVKQHYLMLKIKEGTLVPVSQFWVNWWEMKVDLKQPGWKDGLPSSWIFGNKNLFNCLHGLMFFYTGPEKNDIIIFIWM